MKLKFPLLFVAFLTITFSSLAQYQRADSSIEQIMKQRPVAAIAVAVVKDGKIVYTHSFGSKNLENNIPPDNKDLFRIASISKSFTATSLMQLVQKKKISLDDDVSNLIGFTIRNPKFPDKKITIKMLLSHTSSINDSQGYFTLDAIDPSKNADWQKCYNDYEPGKGYEYCNFNFNIAGAILEKVSGERFDHYVYDHILHPLGLNAGFNVNDLDSNLFVTLYEYHPDSAKYIPSPAAYAPRKKEIDDYVIGYSTPVFSPAGGMKICATDLAKYMAMHMNGGKFKHVRIISRKSEKTMRKSVSEKAQYGLALLTTEKLIPGETLIGHTGSAYGLYSAMFFEPKKKFGIVVITSGADPGYTNGYNTVIREVVNALYTEVVK
jgi:CubicO group peptidase (beta-lactamase class C family)